MKNLIIASTSKIYGDSYLSYLLPELSDLFSKTKEVLFIPYARPGGISYDAYTEIAEKAFAKINKKVFGIHNFNDPIEAIKNTRGVFVGGGNTFVLLSKLYQHNIMQTLREEIFKGLSYLGTSAGSNICGITINNTNDMPIIYPPSFKSLGVIPFNINPHYLDPDPASRHMGETRETRIKEFHSQHSTPVVGIREGSFLRVMDKKTVLKGPHSARIFEKNKTPYEAEPDAIIDFQ